jgi:hypothetical protein
MKMLPSINAITIDSICGSIAKKLA